MSVLIHTVKDRMTAVWRWLREVSGDDAYERYLAHHAAEHPGEAVMTRRAFFEASQKRKWGGITRCC